MISEYVKQDIDNYVTSGTPVGDFLHSVLCNDLQESFGRADENNREALFDIVCYLHNNAPSICWGHPDRVNNWLQIHRDKRAKEEII